MQLASIENQPHLFQVIIDHFPGGVSIFNRELDMVACNRAFRELLDFPDEIFAEGLPNFHALALFNAKRGEYGPGDPEALAFQSCERARSMKPHVFERTRPGGRVLEIRGAPLPEGGFVSIYVDISDRKRAEVDAIRTRNVFSRGTGQLAVWRPRA